MMTLIYKDPNLRFLLLLIDAMSGYGSPAKTWVFHQCQYSYHWSQYQCRTSFIISCITHFYLLWLSITLHNVIFQKQASLEAAGADMGSLESLWRDRSMNLEPLELRQKELQEEVGQQFATLKAQVATSVDFSALLETGKLSSFSSFWWLLFYCQLGPPVDIGGGREESCSSKHRPFQADISNYLWMYTKAICRGPTHPIESLYLRDPVEHWFVSAPYSPSICIPWSCLVAHSYRSACSEALQAQSGRGSSHQLSGSDGQQCLHPGLLADVESNGSSLSSCHQLWGAACAWKCILIETWWPTVSSHKTIFWLFLHKQKCCHSQYQRMSWSKRRLKQQRSRGMISLDLLSFCWPRSDQTRWRVCLALLWEDWISFSIHLIHKLYCWKFLKRQAHHSALASVCFSANMQQLNGNIALSKFSIA